MLRTQNPRMRFRGWFTDAHPDSIVYLPLCPTVHLFSVLFLPHACVRAFARISPSLPPSRLSWYFAGALLSMGACSVWTAEEPWFTKRTRQNISRIVHVSAINQGLAAVAERAPGPCFCNKVRVVSDLCAISPRHLPRTTRDDPTRRLPQYGSFRLGSRKPAK